jgi:hypothetical protein
MSLGPQKLSRWERIEAGAERVLWAALLGMAAGVLYLLYALTSADGFASAFNQFPPAEQARILSQLRVACDLLTYSSWVALAALAVRSWRAPEWGYAALLVGLLFVLAAPHVLVFMLMGQRGTPSLAISLILDTLRAVGTTALGVGGVLAARDLLERVLARRWHARVLAARATSPPRVRALPLDTRQDRFLGKCWELPMCRPSIRQSCAVFIRGKQPCWRIGVGCMCSEQLLVMAARTRGEDLTQPTGSTGTWKPQIITLEQLASRLTPAQKRERCMNCSIYLHHQAQKYRALLPAVCAGTAAVLAALLPWLHRGFVTFANATDELTGAAARRGAPAESLHPALKEWSGKLAEAYVAEWILFLCLGLVVLSYALRALEYAITRRGW